MVGFNIQNTVMLFPNSFGGGMEYRIDPRIRELACGSMPAPAHRRGYCLVPLDLTLSSEPLESFSLSFLLIGYK